ncbi:hypothetical protein [Enterococcus sp. DIV0187]|jgi:capsular polysaccharide biosynthesis protein|uniref:hypothetical protein n=1 Tax=Enterococcus sp. DIV0187 TaxID=2774644 RepID=UPI003F28A0B3
MKVKKDTVFFALKKFGLLIVVIAGSIALFVGTFYESVIPKIYDAKSQILISEDEKTRQTTMQPFDLKYIGTYSIYMYTDEFLMNVHDQINLSKLDKKYSLDDLKNNLKILISDNSQIVSVQFFSDSSRDSIYLSNLIAKNAVKRIPKKLNNYQLSMVSKAKRSEVQKSLNKKQFVLIIFLMFVALESIIILYIFCFNEYVHFKKQIEVTLGEKKIYEL